MHVTRKTEKAENHRPNTEPRHCVITLTYCYVVSQLYGCFDSAYKASNLSLSPPARDHFPWHSTYFD